MNFLINPFVSFPPAGGGPASETRQPTSGSGGGWTGSYLDVDDDPASIDGNSMSSDTDTETVEFGFSASAIVDADSAMVPTVRINAERAGLGTLDLKVRLMKGGVSQGQATLDIPALSGATVYEFSNAGWEQDYTEAEADALKVQVENSSGDKSVQMNAIALDMDYTQA